MFALSDLLFQFDVFARQFVRSFLDAAFQTFIQMLQIVFGGGAFANFPVNGEICQAERENSGNAGEKKHSGSVGQTRAQVGFALI